MDFKERFRLFLEALKEKNFSDFSKAISANAPCSVISWSGRSIDVQTFLKLHQEWCASKKGRLDYETCVVYESGDLGFGSISATYLGADDSANDKKIYCSFLFKKIAGNWVLIHDQSTEIKEEST